MDYTKLQLRESLQKARLALALEDRRQKSEAIAESLLQAVDWPKNTLVHCFEPIMRLGEVNLVDFVTALQAENLDTHVYTSRKLDGGWQMVSMDTDKPAQPVPEFDVIIVPMLGFDEQLHRVGYGGGYYDRFLASQTQARKIGVCYEAGKITKIPAEPHDISLDMVITDYKIYT